MLEQLPLPGPGFGPAPLHNLFFAVRPDQAAAARMTRLAGRLRDAHGFRRRPLGPDRLHLSLLKLGRCPRVTPELVAWIGRAAAGVTLAPFDIAFDRVATFRGKPGSLPIVLHGSGGVGSLAALRQALAEAITRSGIDPRELPGFNPHVTLLYGERSIDQQIVATIRWPARDFVLIDSPYGEGRHEALGCWPLRG